MKNIVIIIFFSMMFLACENSSTVDKTPHTSKYQKALSLVEKCDKLMMIKLTSEDCHFCKKMDSEVLKDSEVKSFLNKNFVLLNIDVRKEKLPLPLNYSVTPTFFFIDKHENIIYKIQGAWHKKDFMELLTMVLKKREGDKK